MALQWKQVPKVIPPRFAPIPPPPGLDPPEKLERKDPNEGLNHPDIHGIATETFAGTDKIRVEVPCGAVFTFALRYGVWWVSIPFGQQCKQLYQRKAFEELGIYQQKNPMFDGATFAYSCSQCSWETKRRHSKCTGVIFKERGFFDCGRHGSFLMIFPSFGLLLKRDKAPIEKEEIQPTRPLLDSAGCLTIFQ